ncbi:permease for cytosine/purines, uracil, thiamine, allantoin-domain-containing protein [Myxozyma melibiosi]|uniref:Permease for cytosine/purines, uracil, thiamine, allantoin-domain-containing protein n=1 Tax=Myxozyma melibiosi TaxID=54550 RepID=A0ABR1F0C2_9ASCO
MEEKTYEVRATPLDVANGTTTELTSSPKSGFWHSIDQFIKLDSASDVRRSNADLDPVPLEGRTWRMRHYALFWISDHLSVSGFRAAASVMEVGLSWRLALLCISLANIFQGVFITINGVVGAQYHIPFSIQARASFGYYFSYVMILMRMIVAIFWYGIQAYTGAECVQSILYALWPSFRNVPNTLPESANITTQFMTAYVIYFVMCLPLHYVGVQRLKWLFLVKAIATPIACFALLGWTVAKVGVGKDSLFNQGNTVHGSTLAWAFMRSLYSNIGSGVTLMVNAPDYSRYATTQPATYATAVAVPFTATVMTLIGVIVASGSKVLYGTILWDPLLIVNNWTSSGGRAAAFFISFSFLLSQLGLNIAANSLAAANDMNCLLPRYINIRRGQFIASILGSWALTPWNILTSAPAFLNFMSGYSVWLGPLCGILVSDFFFVHKKKYDVYELYNFEGMYKYYRGFNWRSAVAFTIGWVPLLPGFLPSVSNIYSTPAMIHLYDLGFFYGFGAACLSYYVVCRFWPATETYVERGVFIDDFINSSSADDIAEELGYTDENSMEKKSA